MSAGTLKQPEVYINPQNCDFNIVCSGVFKQLRSLVSCVMDIGLPIEFKKYWRHAIGPCENKNRYEKKGFMKNVVSHMLCIVVFGQTIPKCNAAPLFLKRQMCKQLHNVYTTENTSVSSNTKCK